MTRGRPLLRLRSAPVVAVIGSTPALHKNSYVAGCEEGHKEGRRDRRITFLLSCLPYSLSCLPYSLSDFAAGLAFATSAGRITLPPARWRRGPTGQLWRP